MDITCTPEELIWLERIGVAAQELGLPAFLIGGFVRDKLLGRPTKDADVVCLGDGIALAHAVADRLHPRPRVNYFKTYGTAHMKVQGFEVEFVGARKESYSSHSRKPE